MGCWWSTGTGGSERFRRAGPSLALPIPLLYLEFVGEILGIALRWACMAAAMVCLLCSAPAAAQQAPDDAAAREYFKAGRAAFEQADYESALIYFRHAYRASARAKLQYNIGVTADRLQREREALEAFEQYLNDVEQPARDAEVRVRVRALRESLAKQEAALEGAPASFSARADESASRARRDAFQMPEYKQLSDQPTAKKKKWPWIVAAAAVMVAGGVTAGVVLSQRSKASQPVGNGFSVSW